VTGKGTVYGFNPNDGKELFKETLEGLKDDYITLCANNVNLSQHHTNNVTLRDILRKG